MERAIVYLLWSNKHKAWWRPGDWGYTLHINEAAEYSESEAIERVVRSAQGGRLDEVTCMVAAPSNWQPRKDVHNGD